MKTNNDVKVIGGHGNFWLYRKHEGFDLTHPTSPDSDPIVPRIKLETTKEDCTIDPGKTALVVIDLQNYFLSPLLGRPSESVGLCAVEQLLKKAIPGCRRAGIPIVWLGWGLTDDDLDTRPPQSFLKDLGQVMGQMTLEDGTQTDAGRAVMQNQWNTQIYTGLVEASRPDHDIWVYKNRLSGFWAGATEIAKVLRERDIKTLLFAGGNTDQCVAESMQDAYTRGWDVLMLSDACGTTSPEFARQATEFNCENGWGFMLTCEQFAKGVQEGMGRVR